MGLCNCRIGFVTFFSAWNGTMSPPTASHTSAVSSKRLEKHFLVTSKERAPKQFSECCPSRPGDRGRVCHVWYGTAGSLLRCFSRCDRDLRPRVAPLKGSAMRRLNEGSTPSIGAADDESWQKGFPRMEGTMAIKAVGCGERLNRSCCSL